MNNEECEILEYYDNKNSVINYISVIILFITSVLLLIYMIYNI